MTQQQDYKYKYELHAHTAECDLCASMSGGEMVKVYHDLGYSGIVITDHYFSLFFEWFAAELSSASHTEIIRRWLRGYESARNEGERLGFTVLAGAEVRFDGEINDYLIYGVEPEFFYSAPLLNRLGSVERLCEVLPEGGLVVQAHPFRDGMTVRDPSHLFGIEGYNGGTAPFRNQMAKTFAAHYGKPLTSGSDVHHLPGAGKGGIVTDTPIRTVGDLTQVLTSGAYRLIEDGERK